LWKEGNREAGVEMLEMLEVVEVMEVVEGGWGVVREIRKLGRGEWRINEVLGQIGRLKQD